MKKRFFALLLALCVALSMMPAMALAATTTADEENYENLTLVGENDKGTTMTIGKTYSTKYYGWGEFELGKGETWYQGFGILQGSLKEDKANKFKIISASKLKKPSCMTIKQVKKTGLYEISFNDKAVIGETYSITYTASGKTYKMSFKCVMPELGIYKTDEATKENLTTVEASTKEAGGTGTFYVIPREEGYTLHLDESGSWDIDEVTCTTEASGHLKVTLPDVITNNFGLYFVADNGESSLEKYVEVEKNFEDIYLIGDNEDGTKRTAGKTYTTEYWGLGGWELGIGDTWENAFGILQGSRKDGANKFKIISPSKFETSDCIEIKKSGNTGGYKISFNDKAVLGEKYCISYTESGKTYKMYIKCTMPTIGFYKADEANEANLIKGSDICKEVGVGGSFYVIAKDGYKLSVRKNGCYDIDKITYTTESSGHIKVTIPKDFTGDMGLCLKADDGNSRYEKFIELKNQIIGVYKDAEGTQPIEDAVIDNLSEFYLVGNYTPASDEKVAFCGNGPVAGLDMEPDSINSKGQPYIKVNVTGKFKSFQYDFDLFRDPTDKYEEKQLGRLTVTVTKSTNDMSAADLKDVTKQIAKDVGVDLSAKKTSSGIKVTVGDRSDYSTVSLKSQGYKIKYQFMRSTRKGGGYSAIKTTTSKTYTDTKAKKGKKYFYRCNILFYDANGKLIAKSGIDQSDWTSAKR